MVGHIIRNVTRRSALIGITAGITLYSVAGQTRQVYEEKSKLKSGDFTWHPERAPYGLVMILVSLSEQLVYVYRNGIRISVSTCSTGKQGYQTPTGVFTILQKDKHHHSSIYNNASMPNMERLTWSGIAMHAGHLPGYPASHGCIRLPFDFSAHLFDIVHVGTPVIITNKHEQPQEITSSGLVLGQYDKHKLKEIIDKLKNKTIPQVVTSVLISSFDKKILILENADIVAEGNVKIRDPQTPMGEHVFTLKETHDGQQDLVWHVVKYNLKIQDTVLESEDNIMQRVEIDEEVITEIKKRIHPGMMMLITELPLHPDQRSGEDFVILTQSEN